MLDLNFIKVLVCHDNPLCHVGVAATLGRCADIDVREGEAAACEGWADVVVCDYHRGTALALANGQGGRALGPRVVIVTVSDRECEIRAALASGVLGYLLAGCASDELVVAVRAVHRGERSLSQKVATRLADYLASEALTSREEDVLRLLVEGLCNKLIASRLGIEVGTVKSHLRSLFEKLRVSSRTQAAAIAERRGLLASAGLVSRRDSAAPASPVLGSAQFEPRRSRGSATASL